LFDFFKKDQGRIRTAFQSLVTVQVFHAQPFGRLLLGKLGGLPRGAQKHTEGDLRIYRNRKILWIQNYIITWKGTMHLAVSGFFKIEIQGFSKVNF